MVTSQRVRFLQFERCSYSNKQRLCVKSTHELNRISYNLKDYFPEMENKSKSEMPLLKTQASNTSLMEVYICHTGIKTIEDHHLCIIGNRKYKADA